MKLSPRVCAAIALNILFLVLAALGCTKQQVHSKDTGGKGGAGTIVVIPKYKGANLQNYPVFIDWSTSAGDPPPPGHDDTAYSAVQNSGEYVAVFDKLQSGKYRLTAQGTDSSTDRPIYAFQWADLNEPDTMKVVLEMQVQ